MSFDHEIEDVLEKTMVERCSFDATYPPPLSMIERVVGRAELFLSQHKLNVVVFLCENGFQKCGLLISCVMLHIGISMDAKEASSFFISDRISQGKELFSPSITRYIHYYEAVLRLPEIVTYAYRLDSVRFVTVPNFDSSLLTTGCSPQMVIQLLQVSKDSIQLLPIYNMADDPNTEVKRVEADNEMFVLDFKRSNINIFGDIVFEFYSDPHFLFQIPFNTTFIENNYLMF